MNYNLKITMFKRFILLLTVFYLASCVPNKDLVYLQGKPVVKKNVHKLNDVPYKLQVHDVIVIDLKAKNEESVALFKKVAKSAGGQQLNTQGFESGADVSGYNIDRHGNIRLPYIGEMNVLGYTTKEVRKKFEQEILKYIKDIGDIFVTVRLAGIKYNIMGEIKSPGVKVINQNRVSILEAISNAGDITITGDRKKIEIWRNTISGKKKYEIDLTSVEAFDSEIFYIQPNDLIIVVPLRQKAWGTGTTGLQSITTLLSVFTLITSTILLVKNL